MTGCFLENGHDGAPLLVVPPELVFELHCCNMIISNVFRNGPKLLLPMVSLLWMALQIIEHSLLVPVKTHFAQRALGGAKNKPENSGRS